MRAWTTIGTASVVGGKDLVLQERDGVFVVRAGGHELMSSARHGSEEALAELGLSSVRGARPAVLIGGLGLGFTLRAALDRLPGASAVVVVEISEAVVEWNRGPLAGLARAPLDDSRVRVELDDVARVISRQAGAFDAILLDVDNGPSALARSSNQHLYGRAGLAAIRKALVPRGVLAVWSSGPDPRFLDRLRESGFDAAEHAVSARGRGSTRHAVFTAQLRMNVRPDGAMVPRRHR